MNSAHPRVSICIPCYNNAEQVRRLLGSIAVQTYTDYEVILSDDSTDDAVERLVKEKTRGGQPLRYVHNESPLGHIHNWNAALDLSRGELIKIMFSDDWFTFPDSLEKLVELLDRHPTAALAFCGSRQTPLPAGASGSVSSVPETAAAPRTDSAAAGAASAAVRTDPAPSAEPIRAPWDRAARPEFIEELHKDYRYLFTGDEIGAPSATLYRASDARFDPRSSWASDMVLYFEILSRAAAAQAPAAVPAAEETSGVEPAPAVSGSGSDPRATGSGAVQGEQEGPLFAFTPEPLISIGIHENQYTERFADRDPRKYADDRLMYDRFGLRENEVCRRKMLFQNVKYRKGWREARACGAAFSEYVRQRLSWFYTNTVLGYWGGLKNRLTGKHAGDPLTLPLTAGTALVCLLLVFALDLNEEISNTIVTILGLGAVLGTAACCAASGRKMTADAWILLLFAAGFVLRLNYVLCTPVNLTEVVRQHDVGAFGADSYWQADYIEWFYQHPFRLPEDPTLGQFYHPPLHFWLAAMWMRLQTALGLSYARAAASLPLLSLFYSNCCIIAAERILRGLHLRGNGKIIAFAIAAFHPTFILLSASVNNDLLSVLFVLLAVDAAIRWHRRPSLGRLLLIAVWIGLGMMTKLTAAVAAVPIALVFLLHLIRAARSHDSGAGLRRLIGQYALFACVSFPLGLWFPVYKLVCHGVPLTYVLVSDAGSAQYIGYYSVWERLFDFSAQPFQTVYENWTAFYEYNPFVALLKTSLFGEWTLAEEGTVLTKLAWLLLLLNVVLILVSVLAMVWCGAAAARRAMRRGKAGAQEDASAAPRGGMASDAGETAAPRGAAAANAQEGVLPDGTTILFLCVYQIFSFLFYLKFCLDYPLTCSMDYRYIAPTCIVGAALIGLLLNRLEETAGRADSVPGPARADSPGEHSDRKTAGGRRPRVRVRAAHLLRCLLKYGITFSAVLFCFLSAWIWFLLGV